MNTLSPADIEQLRAMRLSGLPLASLADSPEGAALYGRLSVPQRLEMIQKVGPGIHDRDALLLRLLRARREREGAVPPPAAPESPPKRSGSVVQFGRDAAAARQALLDSLQQPTQ